MLLRLFQRVPTLRLLLAYLIGLLASGLDSRLAFSILLSGLSAFLLYRFLEQRLRSGWSVRWLPGVAFLGIWMALGYFSGNYAWHRSDYPPDPVHASRTGNFVKLGLSTGFKDHSAQTGLTGMAAISRLSGSDHAGSNQVQQVLSADPAGLTVLADLLDDPVEKKRSWQLCLKIKYANVDGWTGKRLIVYLAKDSSARQLLCGDRILCSVRPEPLKQPSDTARFNYARWLRVKGICATAYIRKGAWRFVSPPSCRNLRARASRIRSMLVAAFRKSGLSGDGLALVSAMSFGARNDLSKELKNDCSTTGVTHILSVSGLHVAVVYALLKALLFFLGFSTGSRIIREIIIMLALWFFAFVTGLSPSVNRSALMFSMLAAGTMLGRNTQALNTVLFSAFLLLLFNPLYLYDVGFQLSYGAVLGIVVIYPRVKNCWHPKSKPVVWFWEMACLSVVAQLITAPLTIAYFGQFPNYFLVSNLVAVPLSGWLIYASAFYLMVAGVPGLSLVAAWCLRTCTLLFLDFVEQMSRLPFAVSEGLELHPEQVVLLYVMILAVFSWLFLNQRRGFLYGLAGLFCFQVSWLFHQIAEQIGGLAL